MYDKLRTKISNYDLRIIIRKVISEITITEKVTSYIISHKCN